MIDFRWQPTDGFEATIRNAPFSNLVMLVLAVAANLRDRRQGAAETGFGGFAGPRAA